MTSLPPAALDHARDLLLQADALVIAAGAGMGVDSGLPDFRGRAGFWRAYPALGRARLDFMQVASPGTFERDPALAWGFYGHRLQLYRQTVAHEGFAILHAWARRRPAGAFVFTSNVDGQFQRAGVGEDGIHECHGSIHWLQCSRPCSPELWPADALTPVLDAAACRWTAALPRCRRCGAVARPNILMFGDPAWIETRSARQAEKLEAWLDTVRRPLVIEIGAGTSVPSVRMFSQRVLQVHGGRLLRINPAQARVPGPRDVGLRSPALMALKAIDAGLAGAADTMGA